MYLAPPLARGIETMCKYEIDFYDKMNFYLILLFALQQIWPDMHMQMCKHSVHPPTFC